MTEKMEESCNFYEHYFGFMQTFSSDWYISLKHPNGSELALIDFSHETIPAPFRSVAKGMLLNIEVDNATQVYNDIKGKNANVVAVELRDEDYGQRHFIAIDPNGILIDVIENIPPSEEFLKNYQ